jgi:hypothetical protein
MTTGKSLQAIRLLRLGGAALLLWSLTAVVLLLSPQLRTEILLRYRVLAHALSPRAAAMPMPAGAQKPTAIRVDGDLSDWPQQGVRTEATGDQIDLPTGLIPYIASIFADANFLYIALDFPNDTTDCRIGQGRNDLTSIKFGRSGDNDAFMVNGLLHLCRMPGPMGMIYPDRGSLDSYQARWLRVDRDVPWDPVWGLRWRSGPFPRGIQAKTSFASGHRTTEWAVPLSLLGARPCETVSINIFSGHDLKGRKYGGRSKGRPWINDETTLSAVVPCPETCQERWDCTGWGGRSPAGIQTRTCVDLSGCRNRRLRPPELRPCQVGRTDLSGQNPESTSPSGNARVSASP